MRLRHAWFVPFLFVAACSDHPLAGNWSQELPGGAHGMSIRFDIGGTQVDVHTAPGPDGQHEHPRATYTWDDAAKTVTVQGPLAGDGKATMWTGKVDGEHLMLGSADGKLEFHRGGEAHGH